MQLAGATRWPTYADQAWPSLPHLWVTNSPMVNSVPKAHQTTASTSTRRFPIIGYILQKRPLPPPPITAKLLTSHLPHLLLPPTHGRHSSTWAPNTPMAFCTASDTAEQLTSMQQEHQATPSEHKEDRPPKQLQTSALTSPPHKKYRPPHSHWNPPPFPGEPHNWPKTPPHYNCHTRANPRTQLRSTFNELCYGSCRSGLYMDTRTRHPTATSTHHLILVIRVCGQALLTTSQYLLMVVVSALCR